MPAYLYQRAEPEYESQLEIARKREALAVQMKASPKEAQIGKKKLIDFLIWEGVTSINLLDYPLREKYEQYLRHEIGPGATQKYLRAYDWLKCSAVREQMQTLDGRRKHQWQYRNEVVYLPYHPDEEVANKFWDSRKKETLVWDFRCGYPLKLKMQIFDVLTFFIQNYPEGPMRKRRLMALQYLYQYCGQKGIADIEELELADIRGFQKQMEQQHAETTMGNNYMSIVGISRKHLFCMASDIHWHAGIWYIERFKLPAERLNQSASLESISFLEIKSRENRIHAKEFMKYELGINGQALSTITRRYLVIRNFLSMLDEKQITATACSKKHIEIFLAWLREKELDPKGYNERISAIAHFFKFMEVRGYIQKIPFDPDYYFQKVTPIHHDRSVDEQVYMEILGKLHLFPEHLRCMFLHLWAIGLRASEVCTLRGNAYFRKNNDYWMQVYQVKMKNYKRIPIPEGIYEVMQVYLQRHQIGPDEYIFKNKKGGAFLYQTFRQQMKQYCEIAGISNGEYIFKSHDYRHTVATLFYDNNMSLQGIRDYLGHSYDEMTQQYIDYMPKRIAKANEEYFSHQEHSLASCLKKGEAYGTPGLLQGTGMFPQTERKREE